MTRSNPEGGRPPHSLSIKLGQIFEAKATGWGVVGAVVALIALVAAGAMWTLAGG